MTTYVYLLSGVATHADFMSPLCVILDTRFETNDIQAVLHYHLPYGAWDRKLWRQLVEAKQDISSRSLLRNETSPRGILVGEAIMERVGQEDKIILIGHSAGGIVATHLASWLIARKLQVSHLIQIGCPKHAIPIQLRSRTLYIYGVGENGRVCDPIVRIGSWGGWVKSHEGFPVWNRRKYAPTYIRPITMLGGHADYFRSNNPFLNKDGISNLELTTNMIWNFISDVNS